MALETCFRAWALHAHASSKDRFLAGSSSGSGSGSGSSSFAPSKRTAAAAPLSTGRVAVQQRRPRIVCRANNALNEVLEATEANWDEMVIGCETPVLVEFWAPWCGPCRMIAPVIDDLAKEYAGKIKCCKVNTDESAALSTQFGIRSIPTVLIFKGGEKKESVVGAVPKTALTTIIDKYIGS